jgi:spore coat polysaccharide biosynthesis protein SpsF
MKTGLLLSVREKATRLPGKVLKPLGDGNVTEFLLRRLQSVGNAQAVILATSVDPRDSVLADLAERMGAIAFRGSEDDKLLRYRDAARAHDLDFAVIVDGDDPFVSTTHIERLIDAQQTDPVDFIVCDGLPLGATGFGVSREGLERICDMKQENNTEIWGHLFTENPEFRSASLDETDPLLNRPDVRMTLDYPEDYDFFSAVIDGLTAAGCTTEFEQIMSFLDTHPEVVAINAEVAKKYEAHLAQSRETV